LFIGWREVAEFLCEIWQVFCTIYDYDLSKFFSFLTQQNMSFEEQEIYKTLAENAQPLRMNRDLKIYMDVDFITNIGKRLVCYFLSHLKSVYEIIVYLGMKMCSRRK
jgi:hypothetical protein